MLIGKIKVLTKKINNKDKFRNLKYEKRIDYLSFKNSSIRKIKRSSKLKR